jgi:P-type Mg2+ transporter
MATIMAQVANPLVIILLLASLVAGALGEVTNAIIISIMVGLSITLNLVQTLRSERTVAQLR